MSHFVPRLNRKGKTLKERLLHSSPRCGISSLHAHLSTLSRTNQISIWTPIYRLTDLFSQTRTLPGCAENSTTNNAHIIPNTLFPLIMRLNSTCYLSLSGSLHALLLRGKKRWNKDHITVQMCRRLLLSSPAYFSYLDTFPHQIMLIWGVSRGHRVVLEIGARQETVFWEKPTDTNHAQNSLPTSVKLQYYFYFLWALGCGWLQIRRLNLKTSVHDSYSWCRHIFQLSVATSAERSSAYLTTCRSDFQNHVPTSLVLLLVGVTQWTIRGTWLSFILFLF